MSIRQALEELVREALDERAERAAEVAYAEAPYDLGPLREAIVAIPSVVEGDSVTAYVEYGDPEVDRPRGYYPGVLQNDPKYGHYQFAEEAIEVIKRS